MAIIILVLTTSSNCKTNAIWGVHDTDCRGAYYDTYNPISHKILIMPAGWSYLEGLFPDFQMYRNASLSFRIKASPDKALLCEKRRRWD